MSAGAPWASKPRGPVLTLFRGAGTARAGGTAGSKVAAGPAWPSGGWCGRGQGDIRGDEDDLDATAAGAGAAGRAGAAGTTVRRLERVVNVRVERAAVAARPAGAPASPGSTPPASRNKGGVADDVFGQQQDRAPGVSRESGFARETRSAASHVYRIVASDTVCTRCAGVAVHPGVPADIDAAAVGVIGVADQHEIDSIPQFQDDPGA